MTTDQPGIADASDQESAQFASAQSEALSAQPSASHIAEAGVALPQPGVRQLLTRQSVPAGSQAAAAAARAALLPNDFERRLYVHAGAANSRTPLIDLPECGEVSCQRKHGCQCHELECVLVILYGDLSGLFVALACQADMTRQQNHR